jgi:hypothetical protein
MRKLLLGSMFLVAPFFGAWCSAIILPDASTPQGPDLGSLVRLNTDRPCPIQGDLTGKFAENQMREYLECVLPAVTAWADTVGPRPNGYYLVPRGVRVAAGGCSLDDETMMYCSTDGRVFVGQAMIWHVYTSWGTATTPAFLAHETTHHLQRTWSANMGRTGNAQIPFENQADCGAGAFMAWAVRSGIFTTNDATAASGVLYDSGQDGPQVDHGTSQQRQSAFNSSFTSQLNQPMDVCRRMTLSHTG